MERLELCYEIFQKIVAFNMQRTACGGLYLPSRRLIVPSSSLKIDIPGYIKWPADLKVVDVYLQQIQCSPSTRDTGSYVTC